MALNTIPDACSRSGITHFRRLKCSSIHFLRWRMPLPKITFISPEIDPVNQQVQICAEFENADGMVRPGLVATMRIVLSEAEQNGSTIAVPVPPKRIAE